MTKVAEGSPYIDQKKSISKSAPAKLNLRLKVVGRRDDGYHLLSMVNVLTSFADKIELLFHEEESLKVHLTGRYSGDPGLLNPEQNLAAKAVSLFLREFSLPFGSTITIHKQLPVGGGLGGGSSDAAAALLGCYDLFSSMLGFSESEAEKMQVLDPLAIRLGADVPYLLRGYPAVVRGIGEDVQRLHLSLPSPVPCLLILPQHGTETRKVFQRLTPPFYPDNDLPEKILKVERSVGEAAYSELLTLIENDLELPASLEVAEVSTLLKGLRQVKGIKAGMSGSGSTIFVLNESYAQDGENLKLRVRESLSQFDCTVHLCTLIIQ